MSVTSAHAALERWNALEAQEAAREILPCCGSAEWARQMAASRPFASAEELLGASDRVWRGLAREDWMQAFKSHPRIGQQHAKAATAKSLEWSSGEQSRAMQADEEVKAELAAGNRAYEERFGRIFLVCAAGKSAAEILALLEQRMQNTPERELAEAAEQQRQITELRLRRWMGVD